MLCTCKKLQEIFTDIALTGQTPERTWSSWEEVNKAPRKMHRGYPRPDSTPHMEDAKGSMGKCRKHQKCSLGIS